MSDPTMPHLKYTVQDCKDMFEWLRTVEGDREGFLAGVAMLEIIRLRTMLDDIVGEAAFEGLPESKQDAIHALLNTPLEQPQ